MDEVTNVIHWLLEEDNPSVRYRALKEILGYQDNSPEIIQAKSAILQSHPVRSLLEGMHPDGYWLQKNPRTHRVVGDGVVYGSFGTTHFCLSYLSELGMDRTNSLIQKAAERYLELQQQDGDWIGHYSCLVGYNIRTFVRLGYKEDKHILRAMNLLNQTCREDGGYLCDIHEGKTKTKSVKSCFRGSVKALLAFSEFPNYWDEPRCKQLVNYFLRRGGIFQSKHPGIPVNRDVQTQSFPISWRANLYEVLYALSKMGYGSDERLQSAWEMMEGQADSSGRYHLDWTPTQSPWVAGKRGEVNKWITFYAQAARKNNSRI
ncbi:MAG: hypothetical protein ACXWNC_04905 [Anaerolineales bacterium]